MDSLIKDAGPIKPCLVFLDFIYLFVRESEKERTSRGSGRQREKQALR